MKIFAWSSMEREFWVNEGKRKSLYVQERGGSLSEKEWRWTV